MQEVPTRMRTSSTQLDDLYQHLDSFIDELTSESLTLESKTLPLHGDKQMSPQNIPKADTSNEFHSNISPPAHSRQGYLTPASPKHLYEGNQNYQLYGSEIPKLDTTKELQNNAVPPAWANRRDCPSPASPPHLYQRSQYYQLSPPNSPLPMISSPNDNIASSFNNYFPAPTHIKNGDTLPQPQHLEKAIINEDDVQNTSVKYELPPEIQIEEPVFEDMSCLSILARAFTDRVREQADMRELFCAIEYPESFTGSEAVTIIKQLIPNGYSDAACLKIARTLMKTAPPLFYPIPYSEKSLKKNTIYNLSSEIYTLEESVQHGNEYPQGVFTPITNCYVSTCRTGCYAPRCPNARVAVNPQETANNLQRHMSMASSMASSMDTTISRAWSASVPRDILLVTPEPEIRRQEAIHELIYTEEDYVRDLNLLDELFAKPLATAPCIPVERREEFTRTTFFNYLDVQEVNTKLYRDLNDRQNLCQARNEAGFVDQIGDIFLRHVEEMCKPYLTYGPNVVLTEYFVKREMLSNVLFANFLRDKEKKAELRKLPFRHFVILPVTRLQRYPLLIKAILKNTAIDHPDFDSLTKTLDIIIRAAAEVDAATVESKARQRVIEIADSVRDHTPQSVSRLKLDHPSRRLLMEGHLTRRSQTGVETIDLHVFLFDHMLLMTKVKKDAMNEKEYWISKRYIPLRLLKVQEVNELSTIKSRTSSMNSASYASMLPALQVPSTFVIAHLGRRGGIYIVTADSVTDKAMWKEKIAEAKRAWAASHADKEPFDIRILSDTTFPGSMNGNISLNFGKVLCSTPFAGPSDRRMIAVGTSKGIWVGTEGNTGDFRHVLSMDNVTQLAFLHDNGILIVLADSICGTPSFKTNERTCQKLGQHISFFSAGICNGKTLIVCMRKKGMDSQFKVLEPVCGDLRNPKNSKFKTGRTGFLGKTHEWFKTYRSLKDLQEFYVGANSTSVQFLKARLIVVCERGFEIVDLDNLDMNRNLPDLSTGQFNFMAGKHDLQPVSMFKANSKFLLCYDEFAFYVNNHGHLAPSGESKELMQFKWEGTPETIIIYHSYVIAFDPDFIEIRNSETGELVQVIQGSYNRCLHYNEWSPIPAIHGCMAHPFKPDYQTVFQLIIDPRARNGVSGR
ncbi:hypothetical protein NQZ79_g158 [Umbelopsis isabellina]|nr:hypothetical protein NQZ79_g158 [Umbelopsis isabellina]